MHMQTIGPSRACSQRSSITNLVQSRTKIRLSFALVTTIFLLAAVGCRRQSDYFGNVAAPEGNVFRFNNNAEPEYLDPGKMAADTDWRIAEELFEGLTIKDPKTLQPQPGVADAWEHSSDGLVYTFHLRKDVFWTDGHPVTANDFVYAWTRVLDPKTASQFAGQLYVLVNAQDYSEGKIKDPARVGVRAIDDYTLEVRLRQPIPYFVYLTTTPTLSPVPKWIVERYGTKWTDPDNIVGNGPFRLAEHRPHDRIVMDRNPRYRNAGSVHLDRLIAYAVDDNYTAMNLYDSGDVDWLVSNSIPSDYVPYMAAHYHDFKSLPQLASYFYAFNTTRPPFNNPLVRRALALAVDRRAITDDLLRGGQIPGAHFVPLGLPDYQSPPGPEFDPAKAAQTLAQAGYPNGKGFPVIEISFNTLDAHRKIAEAIQQMWKKNLNIQVTLHNEEWAAFIKTRRSLKFDVAREGWIADYPDASAFIDLLESTNGNNDTGWKNAKYEDLLHQSRNETDPEKRRQLLYQAEAIVLDQLPVLPIYTYTVNGLLKPYVRGIYPTALDIHPLNEVCIDHHWREHKGNQAAACE